MRWPSPWSDGFPGWHLECTAMSRKYLGTKFDIHGGGMDLKFPHHECEIAQAEGINKESPVNYWLHANMLTLNGKKMAKSTGNNILPEEIFNGKNTFFKKEFSPMVIKFFMLQAHYRSVVDLSEEALEASEKGYNRLLSAIEAIEKLSPSASTTDFDVISWREKCYSSMNDDFNSPLLIGHLFDAVKFINSVVNKQKSITSSDLVILKKSLHDFIYNVLGFRLSKPSKNDPKFEKNKELLNLLLEIRNKARVKKDFEISDFIRESLSELNIELNDTENGTNYEIK